ncbi:MAG: hypothetical protein KBT68_10030 [bacterium]|nr:hypothetical protein [Candidatus Colisoma equi]
MKKLVSMVMGLAAAAAFAIPMPEVQVLTFSVQGSETYADGSALADGECYALVWSADGQFAGINGDGTAKGAGDEVIYIGKIVKGADVSFQIPDGFKAGSFYDIWILDTRVFENGAVKSIGKTVGGKVTVTHAAKATDAAVQVAGSQSAPTAIGGVEGGAVVSAPTAPANIPPLKFTSIKLDGNYVVMEAENTVPGVNYATVANGKESGITTATGNTIILIRPKEGDSAIIRGLTK